MESAKLLWSVKEVSRALGLSPWTIRRYITDRKLATVRLGRRVLIEPAECFRLIKKGRIPHKGDSEGANPSPPTCRKTAEPLGIES
jgi:excisionase family DNA binding protein